MSPSESEKKGIGRAPGKDAAGRKPAGESWFFGIGINDYQHFKNLNNPVRDVTRIQEILERKYLLDESLTLFNAEATRRNIFRQLKKLLKAVGPHDKLFILFSGHGFFSQTKEGFWVPHEAEPGFEDDYLPNFHLKHYLQHLKARHILVVSDSCFSGALFAEGGTRKSSLPEERLEQKKSRYGICSGRDNEEVWDGPPGGHSPFANSIIEFLEENEQPLFRASLLAEEVLNRTVVEYRQTPRYGRLFRVGDEGGQYVFRLRRQSPPWAAAWARIEAHPEEDLKDLHVKIQLLDEYTDQFPQADNLKAAYDLGVLLEHKAAFFIAKGSRFRLKEFSRKKTPFQEEAKRLLRDYKAGYTLPEETPSEKEQPKPTPKRQIPEKKREHPASPNTFTDPRDGRTYRTVELNGLVWLAENLNFDVGEGCWFYEDDPRNGEQYGRLYTWEAAKRACPPGWRLPTDEEWSQLMDFFGGGKAAYEALIEGGKSGFNARLGGSCASFGSSSDLGVGGFYWSATERDSGTAWFYYFYSRFYGDPADQENRSTRIFPPSPTFQLFIDISHLSLQVLQSFFQVRIGRRPAAAPLVGALALFQRHFRQLFHRQVVGVQAVGRYAGDLLQLDI